MLAASRRLLAAAASNHISLIINVIITELKAENDDKNRTSHFALLRRLGGLAQCKGFLYLRRYFMKKQKNEEKKRKKKTILDHFRQSEKQISPFSYTLHMSISL